MEQLSYVEILMVALCTSIDQNEGISGLELVDAIKNLLDGKADGLGILEEDNPAIIIDGIIHNDEMAIQLLYLVRFLELALQKANN